MSKSKIINSILLLSIIVLALFSLGSHDTFVGSRYEHWVKTLVKSYPDPLDENETVFDWWPLKDNLEYKYKITKSRWDFGEKWVNKEFTLRLIQDEENENKFHFHIEGFDEFPYEALIIRQNRIFLLGGHFVERPHIVFPLFKGMLFADQTYEYEFLKKAVLNSSETEFYAPVHTDFWQVTKVAGNKYYLEQVCPRGLHYTFEKNLGIIEWFIPGGYTIELISSESSS